MTDEKDKGDSGVTPIAFVYCTVALAICTIGGIITLLEKRKGRNR